MRTMRTLLFVEVCYLRAQADVITAAAVSAGTPTIGSTPGRRFSLKILPLTQSVAPLRDIHFHDD
jgi:hypothetical protein